MVEPVHAAVPGRALVTGAQGFLGRHVVRVLLDVGAEAVLGVGRSLRHDTAYTHDLLWLGTRVEAPLPAGLGPAGDTRYDYVSLDLRDSAGVSEIIRRFRPDVVLHTAAALRDSQWSELFASNLEGTIGLLEGVGSSSGEVSPRLVLTSSGSVYGAGGGALPLREDGPTEPLDLYGASKRAAEDVARILATEHRLTVVQARVFNLVGPGLQDRHLPAVLAGRINAIRRGLSEPTLQLGPLGSTRDFVDVRDAAAALVRLAVSSETAAVVNVASGRETAVQLVLDLLLQASGVEVHVATVAGRSADVARSFADTSRLQAAGFTCARDLSDSLSAMLQYYDSLPSPDLVTRWRG